jgi:hypothetical protein
MKLVMRMGFVGTARAKGAFVHFAFNAKNAVFRKLRRAERASKKAVATTDTFLFVV